MSENDTRDLVAVAGLTVLSLLAIMGMALFSTGEPMRRGGRPRIVLQIH